METIKIKGEVRSKTGKAAARSARRNGRIPCELYGSDDNIHFTVPVSGLKHLVYTPDFKLAELEIEGKVYRTIMKDIQFHPVSENILHVDFLELKEGKEVKVEIPVQFTGMPVGVKSGGTLSQKVHRVQIKTKVEHLIGQVVLDVTDLELGQSVRVRDIEVSDEIEILNSPGIPLASVNIPRALKSAAAEDEEGEVEGEGEEGEGEETTGDASATGEEKAAKTEDGSKES